MPNLLLHVLSAVEQLICYYSLSFAEKFMPKLFFLLFLPGILSAQGPLDGYLKGKGVLDLAPSFSFNSASTFAGAGGQRFDEAYRGQTLSLFAEYGLTRQLDIVGTASAVFTATQSGLQDGGLFLKYRPFYKELNRAGKIGAMFGGGVAGPLADYEPTATGALGQKAITLPLKFILQWETPLGVFVNFTGGYHLRLDHLAAADVAKIQQERPDYQPVDPQNFSTYLIKVGFPAKHFYLDAWSEWQHTSGGNDYVPGSPDLAQAFGVSYTQVGGTAYYSDNGKSGFFLSAGYIISGRNTSQIRRITFGAVLRIGQ